jgi:hypothetical protein
VNFDSAIQESDEFRIEDVINKIEGSNTLLISEGYPFRSSIIKLGNRLDEVFTDYRKEVEQSDDVVVRGVKA